MKYQNKVIKFENRNTKKVSTIFRTRHWSLPVFEGNFYSDKRGFCVSFWKWFF